MEDYKKIEKLQEYAELEGSETGEYWTALCNMSTAVSYGDEEFEKHFWTEVDSQLDFISKNVKIVEEPKTHEYTEKSLAWYGE